MALNIEKKIIASIAPAGNVTSQDTKMVPTTFRLRAAKPLARPIPSTPPTSVCVVDTGRL